MLAEQITFHPMNLLCGQHPAGNDFKPRRGRDFPVFGMVETIDEFAEELRQIRSDMRQRGSFADTKLVASWLDRLIIAMEDITPMLGLMSESLDEVAESGEREKSAPAAARKAAKKKTGKR